MSLKKLAGGEISRVWGYVHAYYSVNWCDYLRQLARKMSSAFQRISMRTRHGSYAACPISGRGWCVWPVRATPVGVRVDTLARPAFEDDNAGQRATLYRNKRQVNYRSRHSHRQRRRHTVVAIQRNTGIRAIKTRRFNARKHCDFNFYNTSSEWA